MQPISTANLAALRAAFDERTEALTRSADECIRLTNERDALIASLTRLADAYDSLLAAHGKPHGWGLIESQVARETIAKVEKP